MVETTIEKNTIIYWEGVYKRVNQLIRPTGKRMSGGRKFTSSVLELEDFVLITIYLRDGSQDAQIATLE